ncbi:bifunctional riboflavin kinase/FAD synthetase [Ferroacidibacillus organovorans]|uniref:Riboflavin biosynthesis protein n=1 Tax=Ferroacidibacillus organovorans TaxID=1765683 RepID=A0A853KBL4_9BACL|nr:bifunctional riboflavin kinase/FAD synthetase [Ferroacidibacillus organovorans]KYP82189.1 hypothetical protein AYJ22_00630 [Ferroacidibacillus organovorans]OAG94475.1 hypothetical protein AYW79_05530 [Ferroacidibacillus organovorans]
MAFLRNYRYLDRPPAPEIGVSRAIAIGKFDGLHVAHQTILKNVVLVARERGLTPCMFTFTPHPRYVLQGDEEYANLLTPPGERARIAATLGMRETFVAHFDARFRSQTADAFFDDYLLALGVSHLVVGYDFRMGKNGANGVSDLKQIADKYGVTVEIVAPIDQDGLRVSSTLTRNALAQGRPEDAAHLLGRAYRIRGEVIHGAKRGRTIGFPTANLTLCEPFVVPKIGVYAVYAEVDQKRYRGVMNLGVRPTVSSQGELSFEVHILDEALDLYGKTMDVLFVHYLREERRFNALDALKEQLHEDVRCARALLDGLSRV